MTELIEKGKACKEASYILMNMSSDEKNQALEAIACSLEKQLDKILVANKQDIEQAIQNQKAESFIDRLSLNKERMMQIIAGVRQVKDLKDPCNIILEEWNRNDLHFIKKSVPIGVIGMIYEARPNVSVDAACLCLKAGNACFLRGSKDTIKSNIALVKAMKDGLKNTNFSEHFIELLEDISRESAIAFMQLSEYLNLLIPRGSAGLIKSAVENAKVPILETGTGNCHVYVDKEADFDKALRIIINAKCQRVSVCNACESVLIHSNVVDSFVPLLIKELKAQNVTIHGSEEIKNIDNSIILATQEDYGKEYLDYEISIAVVPSLSVAIHHVNQYSTHHSDVIISESQERATRFLNEVDSAVVYHNVSSRFSDGEEFGFGAEIGISTQKIHARGPMGLQALTSYKYIVTGNGITRK